jgi:tetratricopeptide (TPR) repeat protein
MNSKHLLASGWLSVLLFVSACSGVGQQVQAGRFALQIGRPHDAVPYLMQAAEEDPDYKIPYRVQEGVLAYLGRAYYETGRDNEAQSTLEKAVAKDNDDHLAHLYLGLTIVRNGDGALGRDEIVSGLKGIHDTLEYIASDNVYGYHWDPAMQIRSEIRRVLNGKIETNELVASAQRIGHLYDEEFDRARKDEARRYRGGGGGGM